MLVLDIPDEYGYMHPELVEKAIAKHGPKVEARCSVIVIRSVYIDDNQRIIQ